MTLFFGYLCDACELIGSEVVEFELSQIPDDIKRGNIQRLYSVVSRRVEVNAHIEQRAAALQRYGLKAFDSLHLAAAEYAGADVLLTVDKDFIKYAKKAGSPVRVENPISFTIQEVKK
jgi:predicted nucleic acid-binding protein